MIQPELQNRIEELLTPYKGYNPAEIAEKLGIEIVYAKVEDPNFAGAIKQEKTGIKIYVNKIGQASQRQVFTIAHELGHFFLHNQNEELKKGIISYRHAAMYLEYSESERKREEEANHFAAELLMPRKLFAELYFLNSNLSREDLVKLLAGKFGVSLDAVKTRLSYLDL